MYAAIHPSYKFKLKYIPNIARALDNFDVTPIRQNRARLFLNYKQWEDDIKELSPSMSYGYKIHGNIIALLCGVPAFVDVIDSRTREMTDFYKIPNSYDIGFDKNKDCLYELYQNLDFSSFNSTYQKRFENFKKFLENRKINNVFSDNSEFKKHQETIKFNYPDINTINNNLDKYISYLNRGKFFEKHKNMKILLRIFRSLIPIRILRHNFDIFFMAR